MQSIYKICHGEFYTQTRFHPESPGPRPSLQWERCWAVTQGHSVRGPPHRLREACGAHSFTPWRELAGHTRARALSHVPLFATPWTAARQLLCPEFTKHEHWSGLPFPVSEDLPDPGIEPVSPVSAALAGGAGSLPLSQPGKPETAGVSCKSSIFLSFLSRWRFPSLRE